MPKVDYNQIARFEAASELLTVFMGMCIDLENEFPEYAEIIEEKRHGARAIRQKLRTKNDKMAKEVVDTYGPVVREYYKNLKNYKPTQLFLNLSKA